MQKEGQELSFQICLSLAFLRYGLSIGGEEYRLFTCKGASALLEIQKETSTEIASEAHNAFRVA